MPSYRDQREFVAQHNSNIGTQRAHLKNITWGLVCSKEQRVFITLVIGLKARLGSQVYSPKTPGYPAFLSLPLRPGNPGMTRRTFDKSILYRP